MRAPCIPVGDGNPLIIFLFSFSSARWTDVRERIKMAQYRSIVRASTQNWQLWVSFSRFFSSELWKCVYIDFDTVEVRRIFNRILEDLQICRISWIISDFFKTKLQKSVIGEILVKLFYWICCLWVRMRKAEKKRALKPNCMNLWFIFYLTIWTIGIFRLAL